MLQDRVWVVSRWNEELWNALDGALLQGLDHVVVLGQGHDVAGDKLGLGLGKPGANLGLPELGELDSDGVDLIDDSCLRAGSSSAILQIVRQGAASAAASTHLGAWRVHGKNLAACINSRRSPL